MLVFLVVSHAVVQERVVKSKLSSLKR